MTVITAVLGRNVNILNGATIGNAAGKRPGARTIGDRVYIGLNATVLGGITVGDDVLIAPPMHSSIRIFPVTALSSEIPVRLSPEKTLRRNTSTTVYELKEHYEKDPLSDP
jgi:serine acetyltransferase